LERLRSKGELIPVRPDPDLLISAVLLSAAEKRLAKDWEELRLEVFATVVFWPLRVLADDIR